MNEDKKLLNGGKEEIEDELKDADEMVSRRREPEMERRYLLAAVLLLLSCCVYLATRSSSAHRPAPSLLKAFVCFRHGSRAPIFTYATDKFGVDNVNIWPEGRDKLTKMGKLEAYKLGERLRERYGAFLGEYYRPEETRAFATLTERTLMSGQLVLASLFPPAGHQLWSKDLHWQPVPLYPEYIFNSSVGAKCPRFGLEAKANLADLISQMSPEERETMSLVIKHAGEPKANPYEIFGRVWDTVYFQQKANLPVPEWLKGAFPEKMSTTAVNFLKAFLIGSETQRKLILHNYAQSIRDFLLADDGRKMEIHSWHDINNIALMKTLGIKIDHYPEPTSCFVLEMHQRRGQKFYEVFYYDSYKSMQPRQLEMACGMTCSEADLEEVAVQFKVDNYTEVCLSGKEKAKASGMDKMLRMVFIDGKKPPILEETLGENFKPFKICLNPDGVIRLLFCSNLETVSPLPVKTPLVQTHPKITFLCYTNLILATI